ncbi:MAG TPA: hypothetical protein DCS05_00455 [Nitrospiraceae bacterium]|nr:hypothetical protein [Nitrospiraceae bacterium]
MKRHWWDGGDGITNFDKKHRPIYEEAIAVSGMAGLYVCDEGLYPGEGPSLCDGAGYRDLGPFWLIFDVIKAGNFVDPEEVLP